MIIDILIVAFELIYLCFTLFLTHHILLFIGIKSLVIADLIFLILLIIPKYGYFAIFKRIIYEYINDTFSINRVTHEINQSLFSGGTYNKLTTDIAKTRKFLNDVIDLKEHLHRGVIYKFKTHDKIIKLISRDTSFVILTKKKARTNSYWLVQKIMKRKDKDVDQLNQYNVTIKKM
jgi:hypothetical protein